MECSSNLGRTSTQADTVGTQFDRCFRADESQQTHQSTISFARISSSLMGRRRRLVSASVLAMACEGTRRV